MKLKKPERRHRLALTLLFTALVLSFMVLSFLVVGVTVYLLIRLGVLNGPGETSPGPVKVLLIFIPSALFFGAVATFLLGQIPMRRVNKLINQMNRLADGDYRARLTYDGAWSRHPTAREVTDSFNRMAEELQSTEMLRSDFINNFSHEFKTPIVSIAGFAKLLRRGNLTEKEKDEYLAIIETESLRLSQMATNVLNLTKVENQTILTDVTEYDLSEQIRSCILLLSEKWEQKEIEYVLDFNEYNIHANEELLKQVWINLLGNAVKFSPKGGVIQVNITEQAETMTVSIANTGSEIAPEYQTKIFNKFYQADESHASEGNGIGLAIVKRVVELHEGTVSVESGNGKTTFTVVLPK
jgi:signal transduction histidine kinase